MRVYCFPAKSSVSLNHLVFNESVNSWTAAEDARGCCLHFSSTTYRVAELWMVWGLHGCCNENTAVKRILCHFPGEWDIKVVVVGRMWEEMLKEDVVLMEFFSARRTPLPFFTSVVWVYLILWYWRKVGRKHVNASQSKSKPPSHPHIRSIHMHNSHFLPLLPLFSSPSLLPRLYCKHTLLFFFFFANKHTTIKGKLISQSLSLLPKDSSRDYIVFTRRKYKIKQRDESSAHKYEEKFTTWSLFFGVS